MIVCICYVHPSKSVVIFFGFHQEADQIHIFPGGSVWSALHPVCLLTC